MPAKNGTSERELGIACLKALIVGSGNATYEELRHEVPKHVTLVAEDHALSGTREGEELWEQRLRNITSHKSSPSNLIAQGYLIAIPEGLAITDAGRNYLKIV